MNPRQLQTEPCIHLLDWEKIETDVSSGRHTYRCPVPGGWILRLVNTSAHPSDTDHMFIQDPEHKWGTPDFEEVKREIPLPVKDKK
jgi:hypothetical protein